jgi:hypothetical protein
LKENYVKDFFGICNLNPETEEIIYWSTEQIVRVEFVLTQEAYDSNIEENEP